MKAKYLLLTPLLLLQLHAVEIRSGWNLIGIGAETTIEELKGLNPKIEYIYVYDGSGSIGYKQTGAINLAQGVWIRSLDSFTLVEPKAKRSATNVDTITLISGWNLLSLPTKSAITPRIFDAKTIFKYSEGRWSGYGDDEVLPPELPEIETITHGEGFWVYSEKPQNIELTKEESKLTPFGSKDEMVEFLEMMVKYNKNYRSSGNKYYPIYADYGAPSVSSSAAASSSDAVSGAESVSVDDATSTNTQESDVDEADIIKHDGEYIFYIPHGYSENKIYINSFENLLNGESKPLTSIELESKPSELYLINNKLIAIYPHNNNFWGFWEEIDFGIWSDKSKIEIYDVSNINSISKSESFEIDGNFVDTRVANGNLYVVSRFMPYINVEYPKTYITDCIEGDPYYGEPEVTSDSEAIGTSSASSSLKSVATTTIAYDPYPYQNYCYYYPKDESGYFNYDYENPIYKESVLFPEINSSIGSEELLKFASTYAPGRVDQSAFITTISAFDLSDLSRESISIVGDSSTLYASSSAIYLVSEKYPLYYSFEDYKVRSVLYKFGIRDALTFEGSGFVDGTILNQFSLSEHGDYLRIATTEGWSWQGDTDNMLFTLKSQDGVLVQEGELRGLGKEGETIKGVRFLGDKGFIVTFRQTDPLYTIDLSNPANPTKVGELEISGYSSYFHPVSEDLVMSVGMEADSEGRLQSPMIQLFDISDFSTPKLAQKIVFDKGYYSEAVDNHKAFSYRESDRVFALPLSYYNYEVYNNHHSFLSIYKIEDNATFSKKADINSSTTEYNYANQRGVIFSKDSKDYAIYFDGVNLNLGAIE